PILRRFPLHSVSSHSPAVVRFSPKAPHENEISGLGRKCRALRARHIWPLLAMRNTEHGSGLGRWRWVVERTFAWLNQFRRLRLRYERTAYLHLALLLLGCSLIRSMLLQAQAPYL